MDPLYILLGLQGTGRRAFLARLLPATRTDDAAPLRLWTAAGEPPSTGSALGDMPGLQLGSWSLRGDRVEATDLSAPLGTPSFLLGHGTADPRDLLEALPPFLSSRDLRLARILLWVDTAALHTERRLQTWYDIALPFADVILIRRHPAVPNKLVSAFERRLAQEFHPALRYEINRDELPPVEEALYPEARRITTWFDTLGYDAIGTAPADAWVLDGSPDVLNDDDDDPDEEPLFARDAHGRRVPPCPDVTAMLPRR